MYCRCPSDSAERRNHSSRLCAARPHWRLRRVRAVRDRGECVKLFVQSAGQLAVAYKHCAEARDQRGADTVLRMLMDYFDQTLRAGSIAQQKPWLAEAGVQVAEVLPSIVPALAQTTQSASADAADVAAPSVAVADLALDSIPSSTAFHCAPFQAAAPFTRPPDACGPTRS